MHNIPHDVDECTAWAKDSKTEEEHATFLKMAQDWLRGAMLIESQTGIETHSSV
jgi:hypothetical protein